MTTFQSPQNNGTAGSTDNNGFGQRVDQIGVDAQQLWSDARSAVTGLSETLDVRGRVDRNPYGMVLAAVGVGYVLGGGLFTPLTGRILKLGVRLAALPFVKDELLGMAEAALQGFQTGQANVNGQNPSAGIGAAPRTSGPGSIS
ncbi:hypothetical protein SAMN05444354_110191 [Stigmatella aurantiaca]|jgi:hypothetical protein|uniref:Uncharacterized protein n=1 Tax=Stigmatella aurantiaca TaxID=41 RepID=A0A1H7UUJ5_STIAU|nr:MULTISPECIES: hypothetical protein [Stigmatella]SEM00308.1 hypothetical protein SAMN05444354_110191 [Stigmatella aurantiaca]